MCLCTATLSKMSHRPLHLAFKIVLASIMPLAAAAVSAGRGDEPLTGRTGRRAITTLSCCVRNPA